MDAVVVRRSPRARRWRLEVLWGEPARLTVPQWMSRAEVERVLAAKRSWIEEERRRQVPRL
jgi:predicted metal-dependent hydrolase